MKPIDPDIASARACVIDGRATSRAEVARLLKRLGVGQVDQFPRPAEARKLLAALQYDIIVCEYDFPDDPMTGQELVDELRAAQHLPLSSVVVLISGEASYAKVAEAAEAALDAYLVKPYTEDALRIKLIEARRRKRQLQPILDKIDQKAYSEAAQLCVALFEARGPGWLQAARLGAELLLRQGDAQGAMRLQDAVLETKALPWARTGLAAADDQGGARPPQGPRRTLESLLAEQPGSSDAYDLMCRTLLEKGDAAGALATMRRASGLMPSSIPRLQKLGVLAFYYGDAGEAIEALERATDLGLSAKAYDLQGLVLQAALQFDLRQTRPLARTHAAFGKVLAGIPGSVRLARFGEVLDALRLLALGKMAEAAGQVQGMLQTARDPQFDFEAACNALMLAARLAREDHAVHGIDTAVALLARRFAVSKASCELLASAARMDESVASAIREGYAYIGQQAEDAVSLSVRGNPAAAVQALLAGAEDTLNGRLLDLAEHTLRRHHAAIRDTAPLQQRIDALRQRYHSYGAQLRLAPASTST
ncbi:MAG: response regulator [Pseudomonadota bacterium]